MSFFYIFKRKKIKVKPRPKRKTSTAWKKHTPKALELITDVLSRLYPLYGLSYHRITIRSQKTRWGSCSSKKNLNFNYKLVHLPQDLMEYLVAHEYCHLKELNHSKAFWDLVALAVPDYREKSSRLKRFRMTVS